MDKVIGVRILKTYKETIVDGTGIRYSIYLSGCRHHCPGCQNPDSWNSMLGTQLKDSMIDTIVSEINSNPMLDGVTFSGGDPFFNPVAFGYLLKRIKTETRKNVWCYTGYTFEELLKMDDARPLLKYIDTLVDGRFVQAKYDPFLDFRGSSNQRLVNVQEELENLGYDLESERLFEDKKAS